MNMQFLEVLKERVRLGLGLSIEGLENEVSCLKARVTKLENELQEGQE